MRYDAQYPDRGRLAMAAMDNRKRGSMAQVSEAERIIKLMLLVRENGPLDFSSIRKALPFEYGEEAGAFDATRRRFERDKKTLQESGVFFTINDRQQYSLNEELTSAAPLSLSNAQISLLRLLCGALLQDDSYPLKDELRMILVKLGDELEVPDMLPQLEFADEGSGKAGKTPTGLPKIKKAIATRKRLSFNYSASNGVESTREVEPFGCFFLRGVCYVVAFDPAIDDERVFRLDRMSKIKVNGSNPKQPDFDERPFIATNYYGLPFQFGVDNVMARLHFDESAMQRASSLLMNQGEIELLDSGLLWTGRCKDVTSLAQWCIENGPGIRIIEPEEAQEALMHGIKEFCSLNEQEAAYEG